MRGTQAKRLRRFCLGDYYHSPTMIPIIMQRSYVHVGKHNSTVRNDPKSFRAKYQALKKMFYRETQSHLGVA